MSTPLQTLWQTTLETGIETGQTPLLDLGLSAGILPSLAPLLALTTLAEERLDLTTPTVLTGGDSSSWLVALLTMPTATPQGTPGLAITYGGADQATHIASVTLYQSQSTSAPSQPRELPRSFAAWFAPAEHAAATPWTAWPFLFCTERASALRTVGDRWLNWAGLLLSVGLVVSALLV